jgi:uncharacterized phiE125 gp8 family phage protein
MTALKIVTQPTVEPVSLLQAKQHLRVTTTDEDALISALIVAARGHAEDYTGRRLVTQTWDYFLDCFPWYRDYPRWQSWCSIEIPNAPLQSVASVKYIDESGAEQTIDPSGYLVDAKSEPGRVSPAYGVTWPTPRLQMNAVTIRFVCGYGLAAAVPYPITAAILLIIGELYNHREETTSSSVAELPRGVESLLYPYRLVL